MQEEKTKRCKKTSRKQIVNKHETFFGKDNVVLTFRMAWRFSHACQSIEWRCFRALYQTVQRFNGLQFCHQFIQQTIWTRSCHIQCNTFCLHRQIDIRWDLQWVDKIKIKRINLCIEFPISSSFVESSKELKCCIGKIWATLTYGKSSFAAIPEMMTK